MKKTTVLVVVLILGLKAMFSSCSAHKPLQKATTHNKSSITLPPDVPSNKLSTKRLKI